CHWRADRERFHLRGKAGCFAGLKGAMMINPPAANLQLKRAYVPAAPSDGTRILVDRLWPRGVSKDRAALDEWMKDIAPSTELREWFGHDPARWLVFRRRYRTLLVNLEDRLDHIRALAMKGRVKLIYGARDVAHNDAVILSEMLLGQEGVAND
ncbi:MAG: DUF488 domain-containing protein, partial [Qingshengfaniella sp.]